MTSHKLIAFALFSMILVSCNKDEKPKVIYENKVDQQEVEYQKIDSTEIKIADLPIHITGTNYILHPIGGVRVYNSSSGKSGSSKTNRVSYTISNYSYPEITGYLNNIMFQHKDSLSMHSLTDNRMQIHTVTYLDKLSNPDKKILVYTLVDKDTNRDGKYDSNDIQSLYISNINGTKFTKLTEELHELVDWNVIDVDNRLYFRSIEDINKNGAFDSDDNINYFYVDLLSEDWKPQPYNPIQ